MSSTPATDIAAIIMDGTSIERAIVAARRRLVETHRQLGIPLVIWRDGKVVEIAPETVDLDLDAYRDDSAASKRNVDLPSVEEMRERLARLEPVSTTEAIVAAVRAERESH